jgi:hypothetical protein
MIHCRLATELMATWSAVAVRAFHTEERYALFFRAEAIIFSIMAL